jgi:hypothetical protein
MRAPDVARDGFDPKYAQRETLIDLRKETIEVAGEDYPLVGFARILECQMH